MDRGVVAAFVTAVFALIAAGWAAKSSSELVRLRHTHEEIDRVGGATGALRLQLFLSSRSFVRRLRQYYNHRPNHPYPLRTKRGAPTGPEYRAAGLTLQRMRPQSPRYRNLLRSQWDQASETEYHAAGLMIFRLMRPLTVSYLIEKQTFFGDLLVEPTMVDLLRFNHAAFEMLTGDKLAEGFGEDGDFPVFDETSCWDPPGRRPHAGSKMVRPFQRVRASYLRTAAAALVVLEPTRDPMRRCMAHDEFLSAWEHPDKGSDAKAFHASLKPVKEVIDKFSPADNPMFWLRLVGYAYVCKWFHDRVREDSERNLSRRRWERSRQARVHYTPEDLPVPDMLRKSGNQYLVDHADEYQARFEHIIDTAL